MKFSESLIKEIKDKIDIISVASEYIKNIKKSGKNWVALCPFHSDKNPSFYISEENGFYKCFACGEKGDVITLVQRLDNLSFQETVVQLAKRAGIEITDGFEDSKDYNTKSTILEFNARMIKLFNHFLLETAEAKEAINYLSSRGITKGDIELFNIGFAPKGYNRLRNIIEKRGFSEDFLIKSGLFLRGDRGLRPLFFNRIIFPIIDHKNEPIGFAGRSLSGEIMPKYINSPETPLYKKGKNLYGLNLSKNSIQKEDRAFIVEGYMDFIACFKSGLKNVVATCGTAITKDQIKLLKRYCSEIVLLLDGDEAGKKAMFRTLFEAANIDIKINILPLPDNRDPDDFFKENSFDDFLDFFNKNNRDGFLLYLENLKKNLDYSNISSINDAVLNLFSYIKLWESDIIRVSLIETSSKVLNMDSELLKAEFFKSLDNKFKKNGMKNNFTEEKKYIQSENKRDTYKKKEKNVNEDLTFDIKRELELVLLLYKVDNPEELMKKCGVDEKLFSLKDTKFLFNNRINNKASLDNHIYDNLSNIKIISFLQDELGFIYFNDRTNGEAPSLKERQRIENEIIDRSMDLIIKHYHKKSQALNEKIKLAELYKDLSNLKALQEEKIIISNEIIKVRKLQELKK